MPIEKTRRSSRFPARFAVMVAAMAVASCGSETPERFVASAKQYLARSEYGAAAIQLRNALQKRPNDGEARYLLALALLETRDPVSAERELRRALELNVSPAAVLPAVAQALHESGQHEKLVAEFASPKVPDPRAQAELHAIVGRAYLSLGKPDEARAAFAAALTAEPGHERARLGQARLLAAEGAMPAAAEIVDDVLGKSPTDIDAMVMKGEILVAQGQLDAAVAAFHRVIELKPNNVAGRRMLLSLLIDRHEYGAAASQIVEAKKILRGDLSILYLEALLAFRQGNSALAREATQRLLREAPDNVPSLVLAAAIEYELRAYAQAQTLLRKALDRAPRHGLARRLLVASLLRAGEPDRALDALGPLLRHGSADPAALSLAGEAYLAKNDLTRARDYFEKASRADETKAGTRTRLAQVRLALGDAERALKDLEVATQVDAKSFWADVLLILSHLRRNEPDRALVAAGLLEQKQPKNPATYHLRGLVFLAKRDTARARSEFERALELQSSFLPALQNLVHLDMQAGRLDEARRRVHDALAKQPSNDAQLHLAYAELLRVTGSSQQTVLAALERATKKDPVSAAARVALVDFLVRSGDPKRALTAAQEASAAIPGDLRVLAALGMSQQAAGDLNQAVATFQKMVAAAPLAAQPLVYLAGAYTAAQDYASAVQKLRKALVLQPNHIDLQREVALLLVRAGRPDEALHEARAVQRQRPKDAVGFVIEGDVFAAEERWSAASGAYRQAFRVSARAGVLTRLHTALNAEGRVQEAEQIASKWVRDNPQDVAVRRYLAERYLRLKDYQSAVLQYLAILEHTADDPIVLNNLAWAAGQLDDPRALSYAEQANRLAPGNPAALDTLGWLLVQQGDTVRGLEYLQRASDLAQGSQEIRLHLAKALVKAGRLDSARKALNALQRASEPSPQREEAAAMLRSL
jgi:cellulose synthase operon protein C